MNKKPIFKNTWKPLILDRVKCNISNSFFNSVEPNYFLNKKRRHRYLKKFPVVDNVIDNPYDFGYLSEERVA